MACSTEELQGADQIVTVSVLVFGRNATDAWKNYRKLRRSNKEIDIIDSPALSIHVDNRRGDYLYESFANIIGVCTEWICDQDPDAFIDFAVSDYTDQANRIFMASYLQSKLQAYATIHPGRPRGSRNYNPKIIARQKLVITHHHEFGGDSQYSDAYLADWISNNHPEVLNGFTSISPDRIFADRMELNDLLTEVFHGDIKSLDAYLADKEIDCIKNNRDPKKWQRKREVLKRHKAFGGKSYCNDAYIARELSMNKRINPMPANAALSARTIERDRKMLEKKMAELGDKQKVVNWLNEEGEELRKKKVEVHESKKERDRENLRQKRKDKASIHLA